jgi:hypothetical protein
MSTLEELVEQDLSERLRLKLESGEKLIGMEWRELKDIPNRVISHYTEEEAFELETKLKFYLQPYLNQEGIDWTEVWIAKKKGLSIDVSPVHQNQFQQVKQLVLEYLKEEDRKYLYGLYY